MLSIALIVRLMPWRIRYLCGLPLITPRMSIRDAATGQASGDDDVNAKLRALESQFMAERTRMLARVPKELWAILNAEYPDMRGLSRALQDTPQLIRTLRHRQAARGQEPGAPTAKPATHLVDLMQPPIARQPRDATVQRPLSSRPTPPREREAAPPLMPSSLSVVRSPDVRRTPAVPAEPLPSAQRRRVEPDNLLAAAALHFSPEQIARYQKGGILGDMLATLRGTS